MKKSKGKKNEGEERKTKGGTPACYGGRRPGRKGGEETGREEKKTKKSRSRRIRTKKKRKEVRRQEGVRDKRVERIEGKRGMRARKRGREGQVDSNFRKQNTWRPTDRTDMRRLIVDFC